MDVSISIAVSKQERRLLVLLQSPSNVICDAFSFRCYENLGFCSVFVGITKFAESSTSIGNSRISPSKSTHNRARNRQIQKKTFNDKFCNGKMSSLHTNNCFVEQKIFAQLNRISYMPRQQQQQQQQWKQQQQHRQQQKWKQQTKNIHTIHICKSELLNCFECWFSLRSERVKSFKRWNIWSRKKKSTIWLHFICIVDSILVAAAECVCVFVCFASFPLYSRFCRSLVLREIDTLAIFFCSAQLHHFLKRNSVIWDIHEFQMTTFERGYEFDKRQFSFIHLFHGAMNV